MFSEEQKLEFEENGVICLRNFLDTDFMCSLLDEYERATPFKQELGIPKNTPLVVFWLHKMGEQKRLELLDKMPLMKRLVFNKLIQEAIKFFVSDDDCRLLETIIFNKPPGQSGRLNWHQDISYFPFVPNNQYAVWMPFDIVDNDNGALHYALGTHREAQRASTNLHTGEVFDNEERVPIPSDPEAEGFSVKCFDMKPGDLLLHHGGTWHMSGPNITKNRNRRGLSLRYLIGETRYVPNAGSAAAFIKQIDIQPGDIIDSPAFPLINKKIESASFV